MGAVVARPVEIFSYCVVHRRLIAPKCGRVLSSSSYCAKMRKTLSIVVLSCQNAEESYHAKFQKSLIIVIFSSQNAEESYHRRLIMPKCGRVLSSSSYCAKMRKTLIIVVLPCQNAEESEECVKLRKKMLLYKDKCMKIILGNKFFVL